MSVQVVVPLSMVAFFLAAIVWPLVRLWRATGTFGVVSHRDADPFQRFVGASFTASIAAIALWTAILGIGGPEAVGTWSVPRVVAAAGWAAFAAGFALTVAAQANMGASWRIGIDDRPTGLVSTGLYAWVRNPIYTGLLAMLVGVTLVAPSAWTVMGLVQLFTVLGVQTRLEEQHLEHLHGEAFRTWAGRVGRFLPGIGRL